MNYSYCLIFIKLIQNSRSHENAHCVLGMVEIAKRRQMNVLWLSHNTKMGQGD